VSRSLLTELPGASYVPSISPVSSASVSVLESVTHLNVTLATFGSRALSQ
jgi:hypothetical protein